MLNFKSFLTLGVCLSSAVLFTACATDQKAAKQAYSQGKSEYFAQNYNSSFQQIQQAAQAGNPDAQYALGYMYYYGKGTPQDTSQAISWIRKAAAQGQAQAMKALEMISQQSTPQMASAQMSSNTAQNPRPTAAETFTLASGEQSSAPAIKRTVTSATYHKKSTSMRTKKPPLVHSKKIINNREGYTVQLLGSYSRENVIKFMNQNNLSTKAAFYKSKLNGKAWYVLVYGHYQTIAEAKRAIAQLPANLQKQNPWVKSLASIQAAITS